MTSHLVPRPLFYVEAVARHGSVQGASRALGIAASAIDRHIKALEETHRVPLFERLPRGMRPTAAGEAMIVMARRWRSEADRLDITLQEMRGEERGTVRLAAMDSLANGVLPELHGWLREAHPHIRLTTDILAPIDAARALDEGTADVVVAFDLPRLRHQHVIWTEKLRFGCIVAPDHPLAQRAETSLAEVAEHPVVSQTPLLPIRQYLDARHAWFFSESAPVLSSNSLQLLKQTLVRGDVAMITSELDVLPELLRGALVFRPLRDRGLAAPTISVTIDARRPLPRAPRLVIERLVEQIGAALAEAAHL